MSRFDRFMIHVDLGTEEKLAELTEPERLCHVVGVLAIAAKSPIRGLLIVGDAEASAAHVAKRAGVSKRVADSTLRKLKAVGILVRDEDNGAWAVHNWDRFNPAPKSDNTGAERQSRYRAKLKERGVTPRHVTPSPPSRNAREVEGEVEEPPTPVTGEVAATDLDAARERLQSGQVQQVFDAWQQARDEQHGRKHRSKLDDKRRVLIRRALKDHGLDMCLLAVRGWRYSDHHLGRQPHSNPRNVVYDDIELLLRGAKQVETFAALAEANAGRSPASSNVYSPAGNWTGAA